MRKLNVPTLSEIFHHKKIRKINTAIDKLDKEVIGYTPWSDYDYKPDAGFAIAHSPSFIFLKYYVCEQEVKAVFTKTNDPVYRDSCVEFFICFDDDKNYYNLEFNSDGVCLIGYGSSGENRRLLPIDLIEKIQNLTIKAKSDSVYHQVYWQLTLAIPKEVFCFNPIGALRGKTARANFYKCGDDLAVPHFLAWNNICTEQPDFHQPDFFGELYFL